MKKKAFISTISAAAAILLTTNAAMPVFAANNTPKEEVIYIMTDAAADVRDVYAVNIYSGTRITDYGSYSDLKLLNAEGDVSVNGDKITFENHAGRVYLQGKMEAPEIPWNIQIQYFLDGKELTAQELAGKSGRLVIRFSVAENKKCREGFFDQYALQASFTLDTALCDNIMAENATLANVGSDKQITYTILPGKGIDAEITADVHNFEMDAAAINGVRMGLDVDIDRSELTEQIDELTDGVTKLDDGAKDLQSGAEELQDGGDSLKDGTADLQEGAVALNAGIAALSDGIAQLETGMETLKSRSGELTKGSAAVKAALLQMQTALSSVSADTAQLQQLTAASGQLKTGIADLQTGAEQLYTSAGYDAYKALMQQNGLDIDALSQNNTATINTLTAQIADLNAALTQIQGIPGYEEQAAQLTEQITGLEGIVRLLTGNNAMISGTRTYLDSLAEGAGTLYTGITQLNDSYVQFDTAVGELVDTLSGMLTDLEKLSTAITALSEQYGTLDDGIQAYTDGVVQAASGYETLVSGMAQLTSGSKALVDGSAALDSGASELRSGLGALLDGSSELSDGTDELKEKTADMDGQVEDKIDEILSGMQGDAGEVCSFVSEKNDNVTSVQFVIKTDAIEIPEQEADQQETTETLSFWQKLLKLFGIR